MNRNEIEMLHAQVSHDRQEAFAKTKIVTIGEVILLLERQPQTNTVILDFTEQLPVQLISYRGYYEDICIDYGPVPPRGTVKRILSVADLLTMFRNAVGQELIGYKGGDFTMTTRTLVWVAPYSETGRMLVDIIDESEQTILVTEKDET